MPSSSPLVHGLTIWLRRWECACACSQVVAIHSRSRLASQCLHLSMYPQLEWSVRRIAAACVSEEAWSFDRLTLLSIRIELPQSSRRPSLYSAVLTGSRLAMFGLVPVQ